MCDCFLSSLAAVLAETPSDQPLPILLILEPYIDALCAVPLKTTYNMIFEAIFTPLLDACDALAVDTETAPPVKKRKLQVVGEDEHAPQEHAGGEPSDIILAAPLCASDGSTLEAKAVGKAILAAIFAAAARPETVDANRRRMYAVFRERGGEA